MGRIALLLAVVAFAGFMLTEPGRGVPPTAPETPVAAPGPSPTPMAATAVPGTTRQSVISEAQLNQQVARALAQRQDVPFREVQVRLLAGNTVFLSGTITVAGRDMGVQVRLLLRMAGGTLNLEVVEAQAGPFPVPAGMAEALARQAAQAAGLPGLTGVALPPGVQSVEVQEGAVVIRSRAP